MNGYTLTERSLPTEGRLVETITPNGHPGGVVKRDGNLWFVPDGSMYVYWTPRYWRYV